MTDAYIDRVIPEAHKIINGDRLRDYGHASINFERIAAGWRVIFADGKVTPRRTALAMIWVKVCRDVEAPTLDNAIDIAGYSALMDEVEPVNPAPSSELAKAMDTLVSSFDEIYNPLSAELITLSVKRCKLGPSHEYHLWTQLDNRWYCPGVL